MQRPVGMQGLSVKTVNQRMPKLQGEVYKSRSESMVERASTRYFINGRTSKDVYDTMHRQVDCVEMYETEVPVQKNGSGN